MLSSYSFMFLIDHNKYICVNSPIYKLITLYFPIIIYANFASETPPPTAPLTTVITIKRTFIVRPFRAEASGSLLL